MRMLFAVALGAAFLPLAACNKPAATGAAPAQTAAATAPAAPAAGPLTPETLPHRKPGLWRQTMAMEGMNRELPSTEFCTDAASETKMSLMGQQMSKDHCDTPQFSRNLDGSITFTSSCDTGAGKATSKGTLSGDFNSSYKMEIETDMGGGPSAARGPRKMTMTATWIGPCEPGQKGGDMILPGGQKINMLDRAPAAAGGN